MNTCSILSRLQAHHLLDRGLAATQQAPSRLCMRDPGCHRTETVILRCFMLSCFIYMFPLLFGISNCAVLQSLACYSCCQSRCSVANLRAKTSFPVWSKYGAGWPCGTGLELGRFELMLVSLCSSETRVICVPILNQGLELSKRHSITIRVSHIWALSGSFIKRPSVLLPRATL